MGVVHITGSKGLLSVTPTARKTATQLSQEAGSPRKRGQHHSPRASVGPGCRNSKAKELGSLKPRAAAGARSYSGRKSRAESSGPSPTGGCSAEGKVLHFTDAQPVSFEGPRLSAPIQVHTPQLTILSPAPGGPQLVALLRDKSTASRASLQYQPSILTESVLLSATPLEWQLPLNFLLPLVRGDSAGRLATWSGPQQSFRDRRGRENEH